jgi:LPS export ABC transporter protein LptC
MLKKLIVTRTAYYIITLTFITILTGCSVRNNDDQTDERKVYPDLVQVNYNHLIYKNGKKYLETNIDRAEFFEKTNKIKCTALKAEIYNSKGVKTTIISSKKGEIDKQTKNVIFSGDVVFEMIENKATLYSQEIKLDYQNNKMISEKDVVLEKEDGSYIKATSMESDIKIDSTRFDDMELKYFYEGDSDAQE